MFSGKKEKSSKNNVQPDSQAYNLIDAGTTLTGDIVTKGNIRVDGTLNGTIKAEGKVVVGTTGKVEGEITCKNADISGTLKAKISVAELLSLKATANLLGEIETNKLAIEPGANFTGNCSMGAVIKDISTNDETTEKNQKKRTA